MRKTEKILFISYQFPPKSGPGVHRSINLVKWLPQYNYDPIVLTVNEEDWIKNGYDIDATLKNEIPENVEVVRTPSYEPIKFVRFLMKLRIYRFFWFVFYPFLWEWSLFWSIKNYKLAKKIIKENKIKLIYSTSGPFSCMLLANRLKKELGVKWVADLRDPFTDAYVWQFPSRIHWFIMRKLEKILFNKPDVLVVNTDEVKKLYLKRGIKNNDTIIVINNGY
jgi:glycosyltransferase involved in cell wall biosynthesis